MTRGLAIIGIALACASPPPATDAARRARIDQMYSTYRDAFVDVPGVRPEQVLDRLARGDDLVLVDVRPKNERDVAALPGAISKEELEAAPGKYRNRPLITYCTIGARSGWVASNLSQEGWQVENLEGGILAWVHAGGTVVDPSGAPTWTIHVYGSRWDLAPERYTAVVSGWTGGLQTLE